MRTAAALADGRRVVGDEWIDMVIGSAMLRRCSHFDADCPAIMDQFRIVPGVT